MLAGAVTDDAMCPVGYTSIGKFCYKVENSTKMSHFKIDFFILCRSLNQPVFKHVMRCLTIVKKKVRLELILIFLQINMQLATCSLHLDRQTIKVPVQMFMNLKPR